MYNPNSIQRLPFPPTFSLTLVISCLFDDSHSDRCEVVSHAFDFHDLKE